MTNILVLSGHPRPNSFTEQLSKAYVEGAQAAGHQTSLMMLHQLEIGHDPVAPKPSHESWSSDLDRLWQNMLEADHIVIAHPLWWGSMPGELKLLFDRLLVSGKAYSYEQGNAFPVGHLKGKTAEVIMTSDTPNWFYKIGYHSAQTQLMKNQILKFIGLKPIRFTHISPMRTMNDKQLKEKLNQIYQLGFSLKPQKQKSAA